jgi:hypothetical protein
VTVERLVAERNSVAALLRVEGTHRGPWKGIPPSGRRVDDPEAAFWIPREEQVVTAQCCCIPDAPGATRADLGNVWNGSVLRESLFE